MINGIVIDRIDNGFVMQVFYKERMQPTKKHYKDFEAMVLAIVKLKKNDDVEVVANY